MNIKRKYQLVDVEARKIIDLRNYADYIKAAYNKNCGGDRILIEVEKDCYYLSGYITNTQLRQVGHYLASHTPLSYYCVKRGKYSYLFKCYGEISVPHTI